jgi:hypothetical protein
MSTENEKETQNYPASGLLDDIKQKLEELITQIETFFDKVKDEKEKKDFNKKLDVDDDERSRFKNKKDDNDDDD